MFKCFNANRIRNSNRISVFFAIICALMFTTACQKNTDLAQKGQSNNPEVTNQAIVLDTPPDIEKAARTNIDLGLGYLAQGQVARAKTKLTHAIKLAPKMPEAHSAIGYFWEMVGDYKAAEHAHKQAIKYSAKPGAVYNNFGAYLCRQGRLKEADNAFKKALDDKDYPRTAEILENAGLCALKWPNTELATEYFQTAIKRDPKRSTALLELAGLSLSIGKPRESREYLARFKQVADPSARSLYLTVKTAEALEDKDTVATNMLLLKNLFEHSNEYLDLSK